MSFSREIHRLNRKWCIISGGQTGVDRAALDAAAQFGLERGGWCPRGRMAEDGLIAPEYPLRETPLEDYNQRTEWNVRDSAGTLIVLRGKATGGTAYTIEVARRLGKPCCVVDLDEAFRTNEVIEWIASLPDGTINLAGPRESTTPGIYRASRDYLSTLFSALIYLGKIAAMHDEKR